MVLEVFLYVLLYHSGQFFYRKRGHINRNVRGSHFGRRGVTQPNRRGIGILPIRYRLEGDATQVG